MIEDLAFGEGGAGATVGAILAYVSVWLKNRKSLAARFLQLESDVRHLMARDAEREQERMKAQARTEALAQLKEEGIQ